MVMTRRKLLQLIDSARIKEAIQKAERHLQSMFTSTLHELERLQARRVGKYVPVPVVADVQVTLNSAAD